MKLGTGAQLEPADTNRSVRSGDEACLVSARPLALDGMTWERCDERTSPSLVLSQLSICASSTTVSES